MEPEAGRLVIYWRHMEEPSEPFSSRHSKAFERLRTVMLERDYVPSFDDVHSYDDLKRIEQTEPRTTARPSELPLDDIKTCESAFQWRVRQFNKLESAAHVRTLAQALRETRRPLEPLLVIPVGNNFVVVDGHHRLAAYRAVGWKSPVPVEVFTGTVDEAHHRALAENARDKLKLSKPEKQEAAWRLVMEGKLSKREIVQLAGVSYGQVGTMRAVLEKLKSREVDAGRLSWRRARMKAQAGEPVGDIDPDAWMEAKAQKIVDALLKANIGQGLSKEPEVTALALWMLNAALPEALVRQWWVDIPEIRDEIVEELREHPEEAPDALGLNPYTGRP